MYNRTANLQPAGSDDFSYHFQRGELLAVLYHLGETLSYNQERQERSDWEDDIRECVTDYYDRHNYAEMREAWRRAYYPEPLHFDRDWDTAGMTIDQLMRVGVTMAFLDWVYCATRYDNTRADALATVNAHLGAYGWNQYGTEGRIARFGEQHGKENEECTECKTHCHA